MSRLRGRPGNLGGDCELSIGTFLSDMEMSLTLGGRKSLCIVCGPMGI
jgi:hypothetical protein